MVLSFPLIGSWMVWKVWNGHRVRIGEDPWIGSELNYRLPKYIIGHALREEGLSYLYQRWVQTCLPYGDKNRRLGESRV